MSATAETPTRRMIFTADVEHYSGRSAWSQIDIQQDLVDAISDAASAVGLDHGRWLRQVQGDAELALLPPGTDEAVVLADLARELARRLRRRNYDRAENGRMRLRMALHAGITHIGANGFAGKAPVVVCRLRDSDVLRAALAAVPDAELAVIVPSDLYEDLVRNEYRGLRPADFARVHVTNKEFTADAYIWLPGHPTDSWVKAVGGGPDPQSGHAAATPPRRKPAEDRTATVTATGNGNTVVGTNTGHVAGRDIMSRHRRGGSA